VWAGSPIHPRDRFRSIALEKVAALAKAPGVSFFSFQKGPAAEQAKAPPPGMKLVDLSNDLTDFAESAALLANLDLLISVDTAAVHLAGAMGAPVWTLIDYNPDWRWLLDRTDSPWYPTMRLFRQTRFYDWSETLELAAEALREFVHQKHG
jgi:ADP-heptose:LPS heptosyltransferase